MKRWQGDWVTKVDADGKPQVVYNRRYPIYPEVHKDDVCNYYTKIGDTEYKIHYLIMKPKRWKDLRIMADWPKHYWSPGDKPRIRIRAARGWKYECIYHEEVEPCDMRKFMAETFPIILMEQLL